MTSPAHDVVAHVDPSFADLTVGTNLRVGMITPAVTGRSALGAWVANTTRLDSVPFLGGDRAHEDRPGVIVLVRGDKDDPATAEALALRLADFLDMNPPAGYFECRLIGSGIVGLGPDENGFPLYSINLRLKRCAEYLPLYYGPAVAAPITAAFVQALSDSFLAVRLNHAFKADAAAGEGIYFAHPASYGVATIYNGYTTRIVEPSTVVGSPTIVLNGKSIVYSVRATTALGLGTVFLKAL